MGVKKYCCVYVEFFWAGSFRSFLHINMYMYICIFNFIYSGLCWVFLLHGLFSSFRHWGLLSSCSEWASHCGGFSYCGTRAPGHAAFSSVAAPRLESVSSVIVAHRLSGSAVYGIFPGQGLNSCLLQADSLPLSYQASPLYFFFFMAAPRGL